MFMGYYNKNIYTTFCALISGVFGTFCAFSHHPRFAVIFLMISAVLDVLSDMLFADSDLTFKERHYNLLFKTLSEFLCFGILPTALGYSLGFNNFFAYFLYFLFILASTIKFAYTATLYTARLTNVKSPTYHIGFAPSYLALYFPLCYAICCFTGKIYLTFSIFLIIAIIATMLKIKVPKATGLVAKITITAIGFVELALVLYANI